MDQSRDYATMTGKYRIIYDRGENKDHENIVKEAQINYNIMTPSILQQKPTLCELFYGRSYKFEKNLQYVHNYLEKLNTHKEQLLKIQ